MEKIEMDTGFGREIPKNQNDSEVSACSLGLNQCITGISSHENEGNYRKKRGEDQGKKSEEVLTFVESSVPVNIVWFLPMNV